MQRQLGDHALHTAVRTGVEVRPPNLRRPAIVRSGRRSDEVVGVKDMGGADRAEPANRVAEVHVVASHKEPAASGAEP